MRLEPRPRVSRGTTLRESKRLTLELSNDAYDLHTNGYSVNRVGKSDAGGRFSLEVDLYCVAAVDLSDPDTNDLAEPTECRERLGLRGPSPINRHCTHASV